jgi:hypothetical protein
MPTRESGELVVRSLLGALVDPATFEAILVLDRPEDAGDSEKSLTDGRSRLASLRRPSGLPGCRATRTSACDDGARAARGELIVALEDDVGRSRRHDRWPRA